MNAFGQRMREPGSRQGESGDSAPEKHAVFPRSAGAATLSAMTTEKLDLILLLGRPASGKSEIIDCLQRMDLSERGRRMHVGEPVVLDDFPMLWAWFEEDALLQDMGKDRLHTTPDGYFLHLHQWEVLIRRLCLEYEKVSAGGNASPTESTVIMEFSRGAEHGGYQEALSQLSPTVLSRAAVLYVRVSLEESLRKNRRRFNPERPHSILEHGLSDDKMMKLYGDDDWDRVPRADPGHLQIGDHCVPFVIFENEDDVTTPRGEPLKARLAENLTKLANRSMI
jgi:hypothetical protein